MNRERSLETGRKITWCPGCGNFGILKALKDAILNLDIPQENIVLVAGIGCSGTILNYVKVNTFHTLHGRVLPVATGIKLSNPKLTVIGHAGDGDAYAIGLAHFIHTARRNIDLLYVVHNNMVYGLTTGQASPTSPIGFKTKTTPKGVLEYPINPIALAIASGASFVARGFSGDPKHLAKLIEEGINHKGFAFIDVLQPCVVWDKIHTFGWYKKKIYYLNESNHDLTDKIMALEKAYEEERIPIGIFFRDERPTLEERLPQMDKLWGKSDNLTIKDLLKDFV